MNILDPSDHSGCNSVQYLNLIFQKFNSSRYYQMVCKIHKPHIFHKNKIMA